MSNDAMREALRDCLIMIGRIKKHCGIFDNAGYTSDGRMLKLSDVVEKAEAALAAPAQGELKECAAYDSGCVYGPYGRGGERQCKYCGDAAPAQSVEPVTVAIHHVKLKTRKRIDAEIPRTMQGWWADVCPDIRMVLRDAHAADIARCHIDEGQSRDPKDYLCELSDTGWLVARIAIDTIRTEMVPVGVITRTPSAPDVRDVALEEAAKVCESAGTLPAKYTELGRGCAYAIRALKSIKGGHYKKVVAQHADVI